MLRVLELIQQQESRLNEQERQLHEQQRQLSEHRSLIERQRREIEAMTSISDADLSEIRGAGAVRGGLAYEDLGPDEPIRVNQRPARTFLQSDSGGSAPPEATPTAAPQGPVGEAPPESTQTSTVDALPEGQNALLGAGRLVIEPSFEFSQSSGNRLIFRGVEIVTGIQIGLIEANDSARNTLSSSVALRYALTDRLEVDSAHSLRSICKLQSPETPGRSGCKATTGPPRRRSPSNVTASVSMPDTTATSVCNRTARQAAAKRRA